MGDVVIYHLYLVGTGRTACAMNGLWRSEAVAVNCKRCLRVIAGAEKRKSPRYAPMDISERMRFDRQTLKVGSCVEWQGAKDHCGYGMFLFRGRSVLAHRLAFVSSPGTLAKDSVVCHRCDNPPCVNVEHLYAGTQRDNAADREARGRAHDRSGSNNGRARLTADVVRQMRVMSKTVSTAEIARRFNVPEGTARGAINGDTWKTV